MAIWSDRRGASPAAKELQRGHIDTSSLIVGLSSSLVALTAIVASVMTTRLNLRHQRDLARDDRLRQKRAEIYEDVLSSAPIGHEGLASLGGLSGRLAAYGTPAVRNAFNEYLSASAGLVLDLQQRGDLSQGDQRAAARFNTATERLHELIRKDIQGPQLSTPGTEPADLAANAPRDMT